MFHHGLLAVIGGHVFGILIPQSATAVVGIQEHTYQLISAMAGTLAGAVAAVGLLILAYRRARLRRVARTTTYVDLLVYAASARDRPRHGRDLFHNALASGNGYNYRHTVSIWFRGIFAFRDHAQLMAAAPLVYKPHALSAWAIFALWPFSRLVHAWSVPIQYAVRSRILYGRRVDVPRDMGIEARRSPDFEVTRL